MRRTAVTWTLFGAGSLLALGGLAWVTFAAFELDRSEANARLRAEREESVRLALWRMDSAVTPVVAAESARPYFVWSAFYPAERAYTRMLREIEPGRVQIASPLLAHEDPLVRLHFQIDAAGLITSPQVPTASRLEIAEGTYVTGERLAERSHRLDGLRTRLGEVDLAVRLAPPPESPVVTRIVPSEPPQNPPQGGRAGQEWNARQARARVPQQSETLSDDVRVGPMGALRAADELIVARRVRVGESSYVQGIWLDGPAVTEWLLGMVRDILPEATLTLVSGGDGDDVRCLASLPLRLEPGPVPVGTGDGWTPIRIALLLAWAAVLLGAAGAAALLRGALALGDRRAAFVSAVTHELRTPLTTFRMYSELLAGDMVGEEKRQRYLDTLQSEADRLGHLVENVLAYAGLERGRNGGETAAVDVAEMLERMRSALTDTAERAGLRLEMKVAEDVGSVEADRSAVERIVHNLVDNAAKYAEGAEDPTVTVEATREGGVVTIAVADRGPGIAAPEAARIFRPFRKSAAEAATSAPGVGLGLSLGRGLARAMGGELRLAITETGARFELTIPARNN